MDSGYPTREVVKTAELLVAISAKTWLMRHTSFTRDVCLGAETLSVVDWTILNTIVRNWHTAVCIVQRRNIP